METTKGEKEPENSMARTLAEVKAQWSQNVGVKL